MYLERLRLRVPANELRIVFHRRLTVLAGIGGDERQALIAGILASLTGSAGSAVLTVRDGRGRRIEVTTDAGRLRGSTYDDGAPAPAPLDLVGRDAKALRALMVVTASDLGLRDAGPAVEPADLAEARASLAALDDQLDVARSARQAVDAMAEELAAINERIRGHDPVATAAGQDIDALLRRRSATLAAHDAGRRLVPDIAGLTDRHRSLERRVELLETSLRSRHRDDGIDPDAVRRHLLARLTQARNGDPDEEALPVVVDDALVRLERDAEWALLDQLDRYAAKCQVVYLTDDPYVSAWARRRASSGTLTVLEPLGASA